MTAIGPSARDEQGRFVTHPDSSHWPCGHERTAENTQVVGKAGARCRECRRRLTREWARSKRAALLQEGVEA